MVNNNFTYIFPNPEVYRTVDALGTCRNVMACKWRLHMDGKKLLLNHWVSQVRFRKE